VKSCFKIIVVGVFSVRRQASFLLYLMWNSCKMLGLNRVQFMIFAFSKICWCKRMFFIVLFGVSVRLKRLVPRYYLPDRRHYRIFNSPPDVIIVLNKAFSVLK